MPNVRFPETASSTNPVFAFEGDTNTGIGWNNADNFMLIASGVAQLRISNGTVTVEASSGLRASNSTGPGVLNEAASSTNPTLVPNKDDTDTGIAGNGSNALYAIAGGTSVMEFQAGQAKVTGNFLASNAAGPGFLDEAATITNPTLTPNRADSDTGAWLGWSDN